MKQQHKTIFFSVANLLKCWIGLRKPNPQSDQWINKHGYVAKMQSCKAKTADREHKFAGLVVDSYKNSNAFKNPESAQKKWDEFAQSDDFKNFEVNNEGILLYNNFAVHADYDLLAVSKTDKEGNMVFMTQLEAAALSIKVGNELNKRFRKKMVCHGSEFEWDGIGAKNGEMIYWFGPNNQFKISSVVFDKEMMIKEDTKIN